jgi:sodium transport system permease protein
MVLFPVVIIPLLMFGIGAFAGRMVVKAKKETATVTIVGAEESPELAGRIRAVERFRVVDPPADMAAAIGERRIRAALVIPDGFEEQLSAEEGPHLEILHHKGEMKSEMAAREIQGTLSGYRNETVAERLTRNGLDEGILKPFTWGWRNVAPPKKVGGRAVGGFIPYLIILMCFGGAMHPAMDLTAGEKERGTIETILVSAVSRLDLVLGKFLTVLTASLGTALLAIGSLAFWAMVVFPQLMGDSGPGKEIQKVLRVDPWGILVMIALLLPLTAFLSALLVALALYARSYKEAQSIIGPLNIVVILPAVMAILPGVELNWKLAMIPIVGTSLASKELMAGSFPWAMVALIFVSTCIYASVSIWFALRQFHREVVLFRS